MGFSTYLSTNVSENVSSLVSLDHIFITRRQRVLLESSLCAINMIIGQIDKNIETDLLASGMRGFVSILKDVVGSQDQVAAAYGGFNKIIFKAGRGFIVRPISIKKKMNSQNSLGHWSAPQSWSWSWERRMKNR